MKTQFVRTLLFMLFISPQISLGADYHFQVEKYQEAEKSVNYLRFDMASTKLGLVTTKFTGFVKDFEVTTTLENKQIQNTQIVFAVKDMDTDIDGRNEKMWETCLDYKNNPKITVQIPQAIAINGVPFETSATMNLRGTSKNIKLIITMKETQEHLSVDISSDVSLKELGIPDPSILVASVRDKIELRSHLEIPLQGGR